MQTSFPEQVTTTPDGPFNAGIPDEPGLSRLTRLRRLALCTQCFFMDFVEDSIDMTERLSNDEREAQTIVVHNACDIVTAMMPPRPITCFVCPTRYTQTDESQ